MGVTAAQRASRKAAHEERLAKHRKLTPAERLKKARGRRGNCAKEIARLEKLVMEGVLPS